MHIVSVVSGCMEANIRHLFFQMQRTYFSAVRLIALTLAGIVSLWSAVSAHANQTASVATGSTVTFSVTADGTTPFTYQWKKDGVDISNAVSSTFSIVGAQPTNSGNYTVVVSNSAGFTTSDIGTITVSNPAFSTQPLSQTALVGAAVTFTALANGSAAPTYQWQLNGVNIAGATNSSLTLSNVQLTDAGTYAVVATIASSATTSNGAVLTVQVGSVLPAITTQPVSQTVTTGSNVTFTAAASGSPVPTFQWKKNGAVITGATNASLSLPNVQLTDGATYTVVASNSVGSVTSTGAVLTVNVANSAPVFTTQPSSRTVTAGASVTFTSAASGSPTPTYQWKLNGVNVSGGTAATLTIASAQAVNAGNYTVVATNSLGSVTSNTATLTVNAAATLPIITTQPLSQTATIGATVSLSVVATGSPSPTYQWKKNNTNISGATSSTLTFSNIQSSSAATYTVAVTNTAGTVTSSGAVLSVVAPTIPVITTQPTNKTAAPGTTVTFTASATGLPTPTYQWQKNGVNISGATSATLTLSNVAVSNAGTYTMFATNSAGTTASNAATLTVQSLPVFISQPTSQTVLPGDSVTFLAVVTGTPAPSYQWQKNGINIVGAASSFLSLTGVSTSDAGRYTVIATNSAGTVGSVAANLVVLSANKSDFNGDGQSDILWENMASGDHGIWIMSGTVPAAWVNLPSIASGFQIVGNGDFNGDGQTDIVWENPSTGARGFWIMNGTVPTSWVDLPSLSVDWHIVGTGDFSADGQTDILLENVSTGDRGIWIMNGTVPTAWINLPSISLEWRIVGTGDFNGDGLIDILWENVGSGDRGMWIMNGTVPAAWINLPAIVLDWRIVGTGDFNGDGMPDLLWENVGSGDRGMWIMNDTVPAAWINLPSITLNWRIAQ